MKNLLLLLALSFLLFNCNDGDIITETLEFEDEFEVCSNIPNELVFYKTKTTPNESLSLKVVTTLDDLFETEIDATNPNLVNLIDNQASFSIGGSNQFNYRRYDANPSSIFCTNIPISGINITEDNIASGGNANFTIVLIEDDDDGIPAEFEDINGNGNLDDDDTDGDGIPNYLDDDDDGDNVKTITELPNYNETDGLSLALNTDADFVNGDNIPNYLDSDDDADGVLTINEIVDTSDLNPANNITTPAVGADYLNPDIFDSVPVNAYRPHIILQTFELQLIITDLSLPVLTQDFLNFGLLRNEDDVNLLEREVTPEF